MQHPPSLSLFHTRGQFGNIGCYLPEMAVTSFYANQGDSVIVIKINTRRGTEQSVSD